MGTKRLTILVWFAGLSRLLLTALTLLAALLLTFSTGTRIGVTLAVLIGLPGLPLTMATLLALVPLILIAVARIGLFSHCVSF
jgi:hypothetical protein